jgi:3-hydroxyacyl-[acyl-carrier-protein] dehydratase
LKTFSLNNLELLEYQPNRPPFLMIDHVTKVIPGKFAEGYKKLFKTEWYFPIHFPGNPNMPGALQLEALAQMLTVAITTLPGNKGKVTHAISHQVKFKKEVKPGRKFVIKTKVNSWNRGICRGVGFGFTDGELACEADMTITIPEILKKFLPKK